MKNEKQTFGLQISKCIVFLQDFANFKTFLRAKNSVKTPKRMEQSRRR
jgi:vacuolar-type H+-ATPase subunit C/Vma6